MEKRIELEKRHRTPDQVTELNLDNCKGCTAVEGLTDEFVNLHTLSLIGSGLTSLKGFPKLPKLKKLELSDNKISGGLQILKDCEKLSTLNLSGNRIKDLSTLQDLKEMQNLRVLDLFNNEITSTEDYRNKVFEMLPQISFLDGSDRNGKEYEESDEDEDEDDDDEDLDDLPVKQNGNNAVAGDVGESDDEDGEEEEVDEDSEEEEVGLGLKDIYNDNLEDDDSDMYEEGEEEEDDNDISDDSALGEADEANNRQRLAANNSSAALNTTTSTDDGADGEEGEEEEVADEEEEEADEDDGDVGATSGKEAPRGTKRKLEEEEEGEPGGLN